MERWRGKTALVTGASAGIGYAIAEALAQAGVNVVACARNPEAVEVLSKSLPPSSGKLIGKKTDLVSESEILALFREIEAEFGHVDILVNNAGGAVRGQLIDGKTEDWKQMFELNILAVNICSREALRLLEKDGIKEGHIININSTCGHDALGAVDMAVSFYSGTKHMLVALTKMLSKELAQKKSKIRVTNLSPGVVKTRALEQATQQASPLDDLFNFTPLESHDIADAVLYVLGTPNNVVIRELTIVPNGQSF